MKRFLRILLRILLSIIALLIILFIVFFFVSNKDQTVPPTAYGFPDIPQIQVNNVVLHVEAFGDTANPIVIVLHGGPGNDFAYILDLQELSDEYFVVFYDQRGSGLSERVDAEDITMENFYKDLDGVVDYYSKGEKVNLIGHSWGAMLASGYVGLHPEKVDKLVLAEPGFLNPEMARIFMEKTDGMSVGPSFNALYYLAMAWIKSLHIHGPDEHARNDYFYQTLVSSPLKDNPAKVYACKGDLNSLSLEKWRYGALVAEKMKEIGTDDQGNFIMHFDEGVENFQDTVLFLAGGCNTAIGEEFQEKQMRLFPYGILKVIPDAGHTMIGEQPQESIKAIREYLNN